MATNSIKRPRKQSSKSKLLVIQEIYGKDTSTTNLEDTSKYLKKIGYTSLAKILQPNK